MRMRSKKKKERMTAPPYLQTKRKCEKKKDMNLDD